MPVRGKLFAGWKPSFTREIGKYNLLLSNNGYYYYYNNCFMAPWTMSRTTRVSWYQKGKTRKVKPVWIYYSSKRKWVAVASAGPYADLHLAQTDNHAWIPPISFYRLDALPATPPTVSKHWRQTVVIAMLVLILEHTKISCTLHAASSWGMGRVIGCICDSCLSVCLLCLCVCVKGKWLELSTPKSVEI